jgi:hypothetical protein
MHRRFTNSLASTKNTASFVRIVVIFIALTILASCTSSNLNDGLQSTNIVDTDVSRINPTDQQNANNYISPIPNEGSLSQNQTPSIAIEFLPVYGIPQAARSSLIKAIRSSAGINAITVIRNGQAGAFYQVKVNVTVVDEGPSTTLIVFWDVLDKTGKKIHHIITSGTTGAVATDPWHAIDNLMVKNVVNRAMQKLSFLIHHDK